MQASAVNGVLIIYTGGTIGSLPKDRKDPLSPLVPAHLDEVLARLPTYDVRQQRILLGDTWIGLGTHSWPEPLDSSNITLDDWKEMAAIIAARYDDFEGFVILHGTDTLAYTASALSFMLDNLGKPVVLTGSQLPIGRTRSDAVQNLVTSLEIAAACSLQAIVIPEVTVFFRDRLHRGCRTTKMSASSFSAFDSPNFPPLAKAGEHLVADRNQALQEDSKPLEVIDSFDLNVASIGIFPGMNPQLLRNLLATDGLRGVVLQTFGTGNAPMTAEFLDTIEEAVQAGKLITNVTQCRSGAVELGLYDASAGLLSRGVISGMDMTVEAALTKMFVVLGTESDIGIAADRMQLNMKGEQRQSIFHLHFPTHRHAITTTPLVCAQPTTLGNIRPMVQGPDFYEPRCLDRALLRILGMECADGQSGDIEFKIYLNLPSADVDTPEEGQAHFLGRGHKTFQQGGEASASFTITRQALEHIDPRRDCSLTLVPLGQPFTWSKLDIALFCHD